MILGTHIIHPGYNPAETLTHLLAFFGPLPDHLARHAHRATDLPFTNTSVTPFPALSFLKKPTMDLQQMGVSRSKLMATSVAHKFKNFNLCKNEGGPEFVRLVQKMLNYDPKKRISAGDALRSSYFSLVLPQPIIPGMQPIGVPRRA